jgi:hypothetical protein
MEFVNQLRNGGASPCRTSLPKREIPVENDHWVPGSLQTDTVTLEGPRPSRHS